MKVLELDGVSAGYGGGRILKEISFTLEEGKPLAILGPNGCGKTTLLRVMGGLLPYEGGLRLFGRTVKEMKRQELAAKIAVMSQSSGAALPYTVYDTVMMGRFVHMPKGFFARPSAQDHKKAAESMEAAGVADLGKAYVTELSGGQLQRVFLARALAQEPSVILLDEPTSHLDFKYQVELIDYLRQWGKESGHTVVGVLHDLQLALRLADTMLFMKQGRAAACGAADKVLSRRILQEVYGMDVAAYMKESQKKMEELLNDEPLQKPL